MKRILLYALYLVSVTLTLVGWSVGQVSTGTPAFGSFGGGPFDVINLGNLNVHFAIPVRHKAGRGTPFIYDLVYESSIWEPVTSNGSQSWQPANTAPPNTPASYWGWQGLSNSGSSYLTYPVVFSQGKCGQNNQTTYNEYQYGAFTYYDESGSHQFNVGGVYFDSSNCQGYGPPPGFQPPNPQTPATTRDGSGLTLNYTPSFSGSLSVSAYLTTRSGKIIYPLVSSNPPSQQGSYSSTDANGNQINAMNGVYTDTLGQTAVTVLGTAPSNTTLSYAAPSGVTASYTVSYKLYTVSTAFGCTPGISEYTQSGVPLVDKILLPDGTFYQFSYETTAGGVSGRLNSVTLPTGGSITYAYTGGDHGTGIYCADGSTSGFTRTLNPGGTVWTYSRSFPSGYWQTTVQTPSDPQHGGASNSTVIDFQKDTSTTFSFYETQRQTYFGANLLLTSLTCYNTNTSSCTTTAVSSPITQVATTLQYPNNGNQTQTVTSYNGTTGMATAINQYAYGSPVFGALIQNTQINYANLGNGIVDLPLTVQVYDGASHLTSQTSYMYDEYSTYPLQATVGTPNHVGVIGGRGNATTITHYTNGTGGLTQHFSYFDTGNVSQSYDVNSAITQYVYGTAAQGNSTISCGNSFPTSVNLPVNSLQTSTTWNCIGGVVTQTSDANLQPRQITYSDPYFWRPAATIDPLSNTTSMTYTPYVAGTTTPSVESSMLFNTGNSSNSEQLTTVDAFGRVIISQRRQGPSSAYYDSTQINYDPLGRPYQTTMPYTGTKGQTTTSAPTTTTSYDALGRPLQTTDAGSGSVGYTYTQNDVLQAVGPAPAPENPKQKQLEYDALGRLTSVCEITSVAPAGSCGQSAAATGFLTTYAYSSSGGQNQVLVTQNVKGTPTQTRTYLYDLMGRLVSENNPENGTTTYTYDSVSLANCVVNNTGDLVMRLDAVGNGSCYVHDQLHRLQSVGQTYSNSPYASVTPDRCFYYDAATVNGVSMSYAKGHLAEAYTVSQGTGCGATKITDEGFSYSTRGELTDLYELTPHSGSYYHTTASYWANGALNVLSGVPGQTAWTYGIDGEGRLTNAVQGSTNLVTSVSYNPASQPLIISLGLDSDNYTYDPNTGRMTNYTFTVGNPAKSLIGALTWNANGSLRQLQVTDQFNAGGTQTCNYGTASTAGYDDLGRLISADCGATTWQQNFGYDVFGNLTKTVPTGGTGYNWNPGYNLANNKYTLTGTSYDANGNLLNDSFHTQTWNSENHLVKIGSSCGGSTTVCITYDAFDQIVEKQVGSTYTEILYSPLGKTAVMNGQTLVNTYVPLPGGSTLYETPAQKNFWHLDLLGSARLSSTGGHTIVFDRAFAPFGEPYDVFGNQSIGFSFTGNTQDTFIVSATTPEPYDTPNREVHPTQGRWISPDPAGLGAVDPSSPQTFNRYAYVANNPLNFIDPLGTNIKGPGECQGGEGLCSWEGGGGNPVLDGGGGFGEGTDANGIPWNFGPGYNASSISGAAELLAQQNGWYRNCVDFSFHCDSSGKPLNSDNSITVYCGGTLLDAKCMPPSQAMPGSSPFRINVLYPGLAPGDIPVGGDFINCAECKPLWQNAPSFVGVVYGASVAAGVGGVVGYDLAGGPTDSVLFGTRFQGNAAFLNSPDAFRIGFSQVGPDEFVFRIGGDLIEYISKNPHINLWPPSWWFKP